MANRFPTSKKLSLIPSTHPSTIDKYYQKNIQFYESETTKVFALQQQQTHVNRFISVEQNDVELPDPNVIPPTPTDEKNDLIQKIIKYLKDRENCDCTFLFFYPKAALKSYSKNKEEKRYFSPKPRIDILGANGWNNFFQQLKLLNSMNSESTLLKEFHATCELLHFETCNQIESNKLFPKSEILISNSFKVSCSEGNQTFLNFQAFFGDHCFGKFKSQKISLISKPSKSLNLCDETAPLYSRNFKSGDKIALFNRQKHETLYLTTDKENKLGSDSSKWSVFKIYKVNESNPFDANGNIIHEPFEQITYDNTVILVDTVTKSRSPLLKIRTSQFENAKINSKIPVSEIHQCIFQFVGSDGYMTSDPSSNNSIIKLQPFEKNDIHKFQWFTVSADFVKHQFYPLNGLKTQGFCIKKFPRIFECFSEKFDSGRYCKFDGENFSTKMKVWIGSFQCNIKTICKNSVEFYLPNLETYKNHCQNYGIASSIEESAPIMFIDENEIIFQTFFSYFFKGKEEFFDCGKVYQE